MSSSYPGTEDPLSGNTWVQDAHEDDLVFGSITYQSPASCSTFFMPFLSVEIFLDGTLSASFTEYSPIQPGGTRVFNLMLRFGPAAGTSHTLTAKVADQCNTGAHYTVTNLQLDVVALA
jgi:hypothetical protein